MSIAVEDLQQHWSPLSPFLSIRDERDYDRAVQQLDELLDEVGTNEQHPLYGLLDTLGTLVHAYEEEHHRLPNASGEEVLRHLMDEHEIGLADLGEIISSDDLARVLDGKAELTVGQIRALADRFHVSPSVFI